MVDIEKTNKQKKYYSDGRFFDGFTIVWLKDKNGQKFGFIDQDGKENFYEKEI